MAGESEPMHADLSDDVVLVSGSTRGIGREIARELADHGADVVVNGRTDEPGEELVAELERKGANAAFVNADVNEYDGAERLVEGAIEAMGGVDVLVASGGARDSSGAEFFAEMPPAAILEFCVNQYANRLYLARAVLDHMRASGGGRILTLSTDAGRVPTPGEVAPGGAAAALQQATRTMAKEFSRWEITVNTVAVTVTRDQIDVERVGDDDVQSVFEELLERQVFPLESDDVAGLVTFLAGSEAARPITGQTISVTGGVSF